VIAFAGLFRHVQCIVYSEPPEGQIAVPANMWIVMIQLLLVLGVGLAMPPLLVNWFEQATQLIAGSTVGSIIP
jgi:hydrogenase-4 component F